LTEAERADILSDAKDSEEDPFDEKIISESGVAPGEKQDFKSILKTSKYKAFEIGTYVSIICY
jgi:hypothetical protein